MLCKKCGKYYYEKECPFCGGDASMARNYSTNYFKSSSKKNVLIVVSIIAIICIVPALKFFFIDFINKDFSVQSNSSYAISDNNVTTTKPSVKTTTTAPPTTTTTTTTTTTDQLVLDGKLIIPETPLCLMDGSKQLKFTDIKAEETVYGDTYILNITAKMTIGPTDEPETSIVRYRCLDKKGVVITSGDIFMPAMKPGETATSSITLREIGDDYPYTLEIYDLGW